MMYRCIQERRAFTASEDISSNHQAGVFRCDSHWLLQYHGSAETANALLAKSAATATVYPVLEAVICEQHYEKQRIDKTS
jgi:hypothetical protein